MNTSVQKTLNLKSAIVQAPMAGGPTTPSLVAAVCAAGALGSFGFAYSNTDQIHTQCQSFRELCNRHSIGECGWNANFFVFPKVLTPSPVQLDIARKKLEPLARRVSIDAEVMNPDTRLPKLSDQVDAALAYAPSMVSFHLGIPEPHIIDKVHQAGCTVAMSATSAGEGHRVQQAGADFIVAQGFEAGGHRGVFNPDASDDELTTGELVKALCAECDLPVIASGGIMNGSDIATVRKAGAGAVQMGTAFLTVDECGVCSTYRSVIDQFRQRQTCLTRGFSGRPARGISNLFTETTDSSDALLPFPVQNSLTGSVRKAAGDANDFELMSLWAGVNFTAARHCSAAELINELERETAQAYSEATD